MFSIKRFLLFNLLLSIIITLSLAIALNYFLISRDIIKHLDFNLEQSAKLLNLLIDDHANDVNDLKKLQPVINSTYNKSLTLSPKDQNKFQFQVWDKKGNLILYSHKKNFMNFPEKKQGKFFKKTNNAWRIYTLQNKKLSLTVVVAENYGFRQALERNIVQDYLLVMLIIYPILGLFIWITLEIGLGKLKNIAKDLSNRNEANFSSIDIKKIPSEVQPLLKELNSLFFRLHQFFERNKRFAADAAHELRTPLAALKTQTEVALLANTKDKRQTVLKKLLLSVDRCTHVVQQLLTLSRLGHERFSYDMQQINLSSVSAEILAELATIALEKNVEIELIPSKKPVKVYGNETYIGILLRNLVDNAIRYTPNGGNVIVELDETADISVMRVTDTGTGIPEDLRVQVFERFYRILGNSAPGSGLGLAIVSQIINLHYADIKLNVPSSGTGLEVEVTFHKNKLQQERSSKKS